MKDTERQAELIHRAHKLGHEAQEKGIIGSTIYDLDRYVEALTSLPSDALTKFEDIVSSYASDYDGSAADSL
jgi:hypothetical protein